MAFTGAALNQMNESVLNMAKSAWLVKEIAGATGPIGITGPTGLQGEQGDLGPRGLAYSDGTGPTGPRGVTGQTGWTGLTGHIGPTGRAGQDAPWEGTGPQGPPGGPWNQRTDARRDFYLGNLNIWDASGVSGDTIFEVSGGKLKADTLELNGLESGMFVLDPFGESGKLTFKKPIIRNIKNKKSL